jgi:hypothetical protein
MTEFSIQLVGSASRKCSTGILPVKNRLEACSTLGPIHHRGVLVGQERPRSAAVISDILH